MSRFHDLLMKEGNIKGEVPHFNWQLPVFGQHTWLDSFLQTNEDKVLTFNFSFCWSCAKKSMFGHPYQREQLEIKGILTFLRNRGSLMNMFLARFYIYPFWTIALTCNNNNTNNNLFLCQSMLCLDKNFEIK